MNDVRFERIEILDPLRGVAALSVAWFHFTHGGNLLEEGWLKASGTYGWLGVEAFFVISGFVLPLSLWRGKYMLRSHFPTFVLKRIVRLDPPYLATIALIIPLAFASAAAPGFAGDSPSFTWGQILGHLAYINAFTGDPWLIPVFWTLAVEFQFYLILAISYPVLAAVPPGWSQVLVVVGMALLGLSWSDPAHVVHYLPLFALGLATFYRQQGLEKLPFLTACSMVGVIAGVGIGVPHAVVGVATALIIAFVRPRSIPRSLAFMGVISYSLYLLHAPFGGKVVNLGARWADTTFEQLVVLALAVGLSIGVAFGMYWFVERPSQRWSSAIGYGGKGASSAFASAGRRMQASWSSWQASRNRTQD